MHSQFDLIMPLLPHDLPLEDLLRIAPAQLRNENPRLALEQALRKHPRLNWDAYLANYPDVRQSGMDPIAHFLDHGIFEGRKLTSRHPLYQPVTEDRPELSIIISSYNGGIFLPKALSSAVNQTMRNIEIIIVDNASTDGSREIIAGFASADNRIYTLYNSVNCGTLMARKAGVRTAKGKYIIFMDGDDELAPDTASGIVRYMDMGYDIVKFGAGIKNIAKGEEALIASLTKALNSGDEREYAANEMISSMFYTREISWTLWTKAYVRELCLAAYNDLEDAFIIGAEDVLASLAIARRARNMLVIRPIMYYWTFGPGISSSSSKEINNKYLLDMARTFTFIKKYAEKYRLDINIEVFAKDQCMQALNRWYSNTPSETAQNIFNEIIDIFGIDCVMRSIYTVFGPKLDKFAGRVSSFTHPPIVKLNSIGILYPQLNIGGIEVVIKTLSSLFNKLGCSITIFTEKRSPREVKLPEYVNIVYISPYGNNGITFYERHLSLNNAIRNNPVDLMLATGSHTPFLLWDMITLRHNGIPMIICHHIDFGQHFIGNFSTAHRLLESVFKCAAAVTCLSTYDELYLRTQGINAWYIPNPIEISNCEREELPKNIGMLARLGSPLKRIGNGLRVFKEVFRRNRECKLFLIGDFDSQIQRDEFYKKLRELGIESNVVLTGWTDDPDYYLKKCGVLLVTSFYESFCMNVGEAQTLGIPVVCYDLPLEQARDNESIILVPQEDVEAAADAIVSLFNDHNRWKRLSGIAREKAKRIGTDVYMKQIIELINNFLKISPLRNYTRHDYETIIKFASYYSGHPSPATWWE